MKDALVRIVCGSFGMGSEALAISWALESIRYRDGAWYVGPPLSLICAFTAYLLLRRAFRSGYCGRRATLNERTLRFSPSDNQILGNMLALIDLTLCPG